MRPELIMLDETIDGGEVTATAVLIHGDREFRGEATGPADARDRLNVICQATLEAATVASERDLELSFGGIAVTDLQGKPIALALIRGENEQVFVGTARVRGDGVNKAAARSVMDAVNRPLFV